MLWDSYIDRFVDLGLNPEIGFDANAFVKFGRPDFNMMAERLHQRSLTITLHAPFVDLCAGSPDPDIRAITRRRFEQVLEVVPIFKPKTVVCHLGYDLKRYKSFRDEWIENSLETWSWLGEHLKDSGSQLMIENVYEYSPDDMRIVFERLQDQNVGFCLDTGHQAAFSRTPFKIKTSDFVWIPVIRPRSAGPLWTAGWIRSDFISASCISMIIGAKWTSILPSDRGVLTLMHF
jgi:sugar phosphate isomerase/epimerase